jgi:uncharacterized protein (DUF2147 family)
VRFHLACYLCVSMLLSSPSTQGQDPKSVAQESSRTSPVGRWKTVDDATNRVKSLVAIWEENGKLYGKIEKLIDPDPQDPHPRCVRCDGEMKGTPLVGLRILWDFRKDGDQWSGGKVLDPDNGRVYKCYLAVEDGGIN